METLTFFEKRWSGSRKQKDWRRLERCCATPTRQITAYKRRCSRVYRRSDRLQTTITISHTSSRTSIRPRIPPCAPLPVCCSRTIYAIYRRARMHPLSTISRSARFLLWPILCPSYAAPSVSSSPLSYPLLGCIFGPICCLSSSPFSIIQISTLLKYYSNR